MKTSLLAAIALFLSLTTFACSAPPPEPEGSSASHLSSPAQPRDPSPSPEEANASTNDGTTNGDAYPGSDLDLEFAADQTLVAGPAGAEKVKAACHVGTKIVSGLVACYIACTGTGAVGAAAVPLGKGAADVVEVFKDCEERARKVNERTAADKGQQTPPASAYSPDFGNMWNEFWGFVGGVLGGTVVLLWNAATGSWEHSF